jgi:predicted DNA-binding transcriptional regulator AlpA
MSKEIASSFVSPEQAARYLGVSRSWLAQLRVRGEGPPYHKFGKVVRYQLGNLQEWTDDRKRGSTSQPAAA